MMFKTAIGYDLGCLTGVLGPSSSEMPAVGHCVIDPAHKGWRLCRLSKDVMLLVDCLVATRPQNIWMRFISHAHGILLRRLGKVRVVYIIRRSPSNNQSDRPVWHSNVNLVTGVTWKWLEEEFRPGTSEQPCVIAG